MKITKRPKMASGAPHAVRTGACYRLAGTVFKITPLELMKRSTCLLLLAMVLSVRAQEAAVNSSPSPDGWTPATRIVKQSKMEGTTLLKPGPGRLLNIDFGAYWELSRGLGAVGLSTNDLWNPYAAPWQTWQTQANLVWADGTPCPARITVENAPGQWQSEVVDPMLRTYSYSHDGGPITVTITDLPSARYDFYVYGHATETQNGAFVLSLPESTGYLEEKATSTSPRWREPVWQEGQQYVVFHNVPVLQESVEILVKPGASPIPILSGVQVVKICGIAPGSHGGAARPKKADRSDSRAAFERAGRESGAIHLAQCRSRDA